MKASVALVCAPVPTKLTPQMARLPNNPDVDPPVKARRAPVSRARIVQTVAIVCVLLLLAGVGLFSSLSTSGVNLKRFEAVKKQIDEGKYTYSAPGVILIALSLALYGVLHPVFHVPMKGSTELFFLLTALHVFTTAGFGLVDVDGVPP